MIRLMRALNEMASLRTWAMFLAGPPMLAFCAWIVWIVWLGPWHHQEPRQLDILGKALWIALTLLGVIIVSLAAAKVRAQTVGGASVEISSDQSGDNHSDRVKPPVVKTTTITETKP